MLLVGDTKDDMTIPVILIHIPNMYTGKCQRGHEEHSLSANSGAFMVVINNNHGYQCVSTTTTKKGRGIVAAGDGLEVGRPSTVLLYLQPPRRRTGFLMHGLHRNLIKHTHTLAYFNNF